MINKHITFFPNKIKRKINCLDLTFGNGGYHSNYNYNFLISLDKNYISIKISKKKFKKKFYIFKVKIKKIYFLLKRFNFNKINIFIYDQGFNTCHIKTYFYKLSKKKYNIEKKKTNSNLNSIFKNQLFICEKNFFIIYNVFDYYEFLKLIFFLKKIKKFKIKLLKMNNFEKSLNNGVKKSCMFIIYV
ncbi:hypothetical protein G3R23_00310 [Candidatus Carsonella ruddii]